MNNSIVSRSIATAASYSPVVSNRSEPILRNVERTFGAAPGAHRTSTSPSEPRGAVRIVNLRIVPVSINRWIR